MLYQDLIPSSDYFSSLRKKQAFRLKQFVTKTLIPRILKKRKKEFSQNILQMTVWKKFLHSISKFSSTIYPYTGGHSYLE